MYVCLTVRRDKYEKDYSVDVKTYSVFASTSSCRHVVADPDVYAWRCLLLLKQ